MFKTATLIVLVLGFSVFSQNTFMRTVAPEGYGSNVIQTFDNGFLVSGWIGTFGLGEWDIRLIKTNAVGDVMWEKNFEGPGEECIEGLLETADGHIIMALYTNVGGAVGYDIKLIKLNALGETMWKKRYSWEKDQRCFAVAQLQDGGFVIAGKTNSGSIFDNCFIIRTDAEGNRTWDKTFDDASGDDLFRDVVATKDGGFALAGKRSNQFYVAKFKSDNTLEWTKRFGGELCFAGSLVQLNDNGFIAVGCTGTALHMASVTKVLAVRMDAEGNQVWKKKYSGDNTGAATLAKITTDGNIVLAGRIKSPAESYCDIYATKIDAAGELLWERTFGGEFDDEAWGLDATDDGGLVLTGTSFVEGKSGRYNNRGKVFLLRTNADGEVLPDIVQEKLVIPQTPTLYQNYPNPFNPSTTIEFECHKQSLVKLDIYNIMGRKIKTVLNEERRAGRHSVVWHALDDYGQQAPDGLYIARLSMEGYVQNIKLTLIK